MTNACFGAGRLAMIIGLVCVAAGCAPGYMTASDLDSRKQGPGACDNSCHELGMRMGALVLVSDTVPACVCTPLQQSPQLAPPLSAPPPASAPAAENEAGSAATGGYVVIAAAAQAAQQQQQRQQQQRQHSNSTKK